MARPFSTSLSLPARIGERSLRCALLSALSAVTTMALPACVSTGTYDELLVKHERTSRDLAAAQLTTERDAHALAQLSTEKAAVTAALTAEQTRAQASATKAEQLSQALSTTQTTLTQTQATLTKTQAELAASVKDKAGLAASVDEMKSALGELQKRKAESDRRVAEYRGLLARFQSLIDAGKLKVKIVEGRMVVALASDVLFASGSSTLSKEGAAAVQEVAALLREIPERRFQVEGHTDNVPIKTAQFPSNWELASARALTVLKAMVDAGLPPSRVSAASFGDALPAVSNATPEERAQNRRIEIVVVPDLSTLPGSEELRTVTP